MSEYLRRAQAADYLQQHYGAYTAKTLAKLVTTGGGPKYRKLGKFPVYTIADLDTWAVQRMSPPVSSSSELGQVGRDAHRAGRQCGMAKREGSHERYPH